MLEFFVAVAGFLAGLWLAIYPWRIPPKRAGLLRFNPFVQAGPLLGAGLASLCGGWLVLRLPRSDVTTLTAFVLASVMVLCAVLALLVMNFGQPSFLIPPRLRTKSTRGERTKN